MLPGPVGWNESLNGNKGDVAGDVALELLCSISSFAGFEKRGLKSCEFALCSVLFLHFGCRF